MTDAMSPAGIADLCKRGAGYLLVFLYVFNISFFFMPAGIRTRMVIGGAGFVLLAFRTARRRFRAGGRMFRLALLQGLYVACNVLSCVLNGTSDLWFCQYAALNVVYLCGALWICRVFMRRPGSFDRMLRATAACAVFNNLLAFAAFAVPSLGIGEVLSAVQNEDFFDRIDPGVRATGLGLGNLFYGGMITSFGEIALMSLMSRGKIRLIPGAAVLMVTAVTGMFIARTAMVGLLAGMLFFVPRPAAAAKALACMLLTALAVYAVYSRCLADTINVKRAYEFVLKYSETGRAETSSTNRLMEMYETLPEGTTWIWGDGRHDNPDGTYYMHIDVGYLRVIFGIGLLGLLCEFANYCYTCRLMSLYSGRSRPVRRFAAVAVILYYVLFLKSQAQFYFFLYLCLGALYYSRPAAPGGDSRQLAHAGSVGGDGRL